MAVGYNVLGNMSRLINDLSSKVSSCIYMAEQCAPNLFVLHHKIDDES